MLNEETNRQEEHNADKTLTCVFYHNNFGKKKKKKNRTQTIGRTIDLNTRYSS